MVRPSLDRSMVRSTCAAEPFDPPFDPSRLSAAEASIGISPDEGDFAHDQRAVSGMKTAVVTHEVRICPPYLVGSRPWWRINRHRGALTLPAILLDLAAHAHRLASNEARAQAPGD